MSRVSFAGGATSFRYALAVCARNATMYKRTWKLNMLPNFFEPVFYLWSIGLGVGAYVNDMGGMPYVHFLAPGLVCVAAMNGASYESTYNVFVRLHFEKSYAGMLTTPIEPEDILLGEREEDVGEQKQRREEQREVKAEQLDRLDAQRERQADRRE